MPHRTDESYAKQLDAEDPLRSLREEFLFPSDGKGGQAVYLVGNSLGLQARSTRGALMQELDDWARLGVEGHFHAAHPWFPYHEEVREPLARLVGALPHEVVAMNSLTVNLHLLMVSFYRPTPARFRIMIEDAAFPSDSYAVQSQLAFHAPRLGMDPAMAVAHGQIRLGPREGEHTLRTEDILALIERDGDSIALLMLGGVNYYTGQWFDMPAITKAARARGIVVGWDLAHAAGNVPMSLHDWNVDFAAWCSYKYLNGGPGAIAGAFVHERHTGDAAKRGAWGPGALPRFAGWWGNDPASRFLMDKSFAPVASADAWALSNPPIFSLAPVRESLRLFDRATMPRLREKAVILTGYLEFLLSTLPPGRVRAITPTNPGERGSQLSLLVRPGARELHKALAAAGVVADYREPDVIRVAPVPMYVSFHDAWRFAEVLKRAMHAAPA